MGPIHPVWALAAIHPRWGIGIKVTKTCRGHMDTERSIMTQHGMELIDTENVGKVWISRKKHLLAPFRAI